MAKNASGPNSTQSKRLLKEDILDALERRRKTVTKEASRQQNSVLSMYSEIDLLQKKSQLSRDGLNVAVKRWGLANESIEPSIEYETVFSSREKEILASNSVAQATIDALLRVDARSRSTAISRIAKGGFLGGQEVLEIAEELRRGDMSREGQILSDVKEVLSVESRRIDVQEGHPFQVELKGLLDLCDAYFNEVYLREVEFEDAKELGYTHLPESVSTKRELIAVGRRARKILDRFDDLFWWLNAPRSTWAHLALRSPAESWLGQARYALERMTMGDLSVLTKAWSDHFRHSGGDAFSYLLGQLPDGLPTHNEATRPVRQLNAVILGRATTGVALGVEAAGFNIRSIYEADEFTRDTMRARRSDWYVKKGGINWIENFQNETKKKGVDHHVNLLAGIIDEKVLQVQHRRHEDNLEARLNEILEAFSPDAFFFEISSREPSSREASTSAHLRDAMAIELDAAGYDVAEFQLSATDFHIPQTRTRTVWWGIRKAFGKRMQIPAVTTSQLDYVAHVRDLIPPKLNKPWMKKWLKTYDEKASPDAGAPSVGRCLPDLASVVHPAEDLTTQWVAAGFRHYDHSPIAAALTNNERLLPLSVPMLKRLQGLPGGWAVRGATLEQQVQQICLTMPPVVARMLGHQIHATLSGEQINLEKAVRDEIKVSDGRVDSTGDPATLHPTAFELAALYEQEVLEQEAEASRLAAISKTERRVGGRRPPSAPRPPEHRQR